MSGPFALDPGARVNPMVLLDVVVVIVVDVEIQGNSTPTTTTMGPRGLRHGLDRGRSLQGRRIRQRLRQRHRAGAQVVHNHSCRRAELGGDEAPEMWAKMRGDRIGSDVAQVSSVHGHASRPSHSSAGLSPLMSRDRLPFSSETLIAEPSATSPAMIERPIRVSSSRWRYRFRGRAP